MKTQLLILGMLLAFFTFEACNKVPLTGRKQLNLLPESELTAMALVQYQGFLSENKVMKGTKDQERLQDVGNRVAASVEKFLP